MNEITMLTNADPLIRMALAEDITSEDISTNAVMREAKQTAGAAIVRSAYLYTLFFLLSFPGKK